MFDRCRQVADALTEQLCSPAIFVNEARELVGLLKRMHLEGRARHMFLRARSQHIESGVQQVKSEATLEGVMRNVTQEVFGRLRDTCNDYWECFGREGMADLVVWLVREIRGYGELWERRVVMRGNTEGSLRACLAEALACARLLEGCAGGPLRMDRLLRDVLDGAVLRRYGDKAEGSLRSPLERALAREDWYASVHPLGQGTCLLTPSAALAASALPAFVSRAQSDLPSRLVRPVAALAYGCLQYYFDSVLPKIALGLNDQQFLGLIGNALYFTLVLAQDFDDVVDSHLLPGEKFFQSKLSLLLDQMIAKFCEKKAHLLVFRSWNLSAELYSSVTELPREPSRQALKLVDWMTVFRDRLTQQLSGIKLAKHFIQPILSQLLLGVVEAIRESDDTLWSQAALLSKESVAQLALDFRWLQEASSALAWSSNKIQQHLESCVQRTVLEFCAKNSSIKNPSSVLPKIEWFKAALHPALQSLKK